ncbi:hypothetical protein HG530_007233 [Fusarium avenaceum]|nr:hypothetical protein HG530_007233 [Fusarium avenaceum]
MLANSPTLTRSHVKLGGCGFFAFNAPSNIVKLFILLHDNVFGLADCIQRFVVQPQLLNTTPPLAAPDTFLLAHKCDLKLKRCNDWSPISRVILNQATFPASNDNPTFNLSKVRQLGGVELAHNDGVALFVCSRDLFAESVDGFEIVRNR